MIVGIIVLGVVLIFAYIANLSSYGLMKKACKEGMTSIRHFLWSMANMFLFGIPGYLFAIFYGPCIGTRAKFAKITAAPNTQAAPKVPPNAPATPAT
jgi:hypothetical protein